MPAAALCLIAVTYMFLILGVRIYLHPLREVESIPDLTHAPLTAPDASTEIVLKRMDHSRQNRHQLFLCSLPEEQSIQG